MTAEQFIDSSYEVRVAIERSLIAAIEEIEDRVPSDAEIVKYSKMLVSPQKVVFVYKGHRIVEIRVHE